VAETGTVRLDCGEAGARWAGQWIEIAAERTYEDLQAAKAAAYLDPARLDLVSAARVMVRRAVRAWSFEAPVSEEAIGALPARLGSWLEGVIEGRYVEQEQSDDTKGSGSGEPSETAT